MNIKYLRIINSKGLTVRSKKFDTKDSFFDDGNNDLEFVVNNLYSDLQSNFPRKLSLRLIEETKTVPEGIFVYFFIEYYDLFIFFTNQGDLSDYSNIDIIINAINERKTERAFFKGVVVADFDDTQGPIPIYNNSVLEEDFLPVLAVQGTTVLGMGMTTMPNHIVGPVPIPANSELSTLIRGFQRPAPNSDDPRIKLGGRPTTIFLIIESRIILHKETLDFIDVALTQWIYSEAIKEFFDEEDLKQMAVDLEQLVILAQDLIHLRDAQSNHLRDLVKFYASENMILKQEILHLRNKLAGKTPRKKNTKKKKVTKSI
jgi:hypothetical protein